MATAPPIPTSGAAGAAATKIGRGEKKAKIGEMKMGPVACAPRDGGVRESEVAARRRLSLRRRLIGVGKRIFALARQGIGQNCLQAVHQSSARETNRRPSMTSTPCRER